MGGDKTNKPCVHLLDHVHGNRSQLEKHKASHTGSCDAICPCSLAVEKRGCCLY